jgi:NHLM bacteriocin system ABC transporter ATP-binding protein
LKQDLIDRIREISVPHRVSVNTVILLNDPTKVWLVEQGRLSVSTVKVENGVPIGKKEFFFSVEEGHAMMGIAIDKRRKMGLVADVHEETILLEGNLLQVKKLVSGEELKQVGIDVVEDWLSILFEALLDTAINRRSTPDLMLEKTGEQVVATAKQQLSTTKPLLWCQASDLNALTINGVLELPEVNYPCYFPISRKAFLEARRRTELTLFETADIIRERGFWHGLQLFHETALSVELIKKDREEAQERRRLLDKYALEETSMQGAMEEVTGIFEQEDDRFEISWDERGNPLFDACMIVARHERIKLSMPDTLDQSDDPLGDIMRYSKIRYRQIELDDGWHTKESGAMLGFEANTERPIAILPHHGGGYEAFNPETGDHVGISKHNVDHISSTAYVFYPPLPNTKITVREIAKFVFEGNRADYVRVLLMGLAATALGMVTPILTGVLFDHIIPNAEREQLKFVAFALFVSSLSIILFDMTKSFALLRIENKMDSRLQAAVWDRLLDLPTRFFRNYTAGDLATRAMGISRIRRIMSGVAVTSLMGSVFSLSNFFLLFYYSVPLSMVAIALVLIQAGVLYYLGRLQLEKQAEFFDYQGKASGLVLQLLSGVSKFRVSGAETRAFVHWFKNYMDTKKSEVQNASIQNVHHVFNVSFGMFMSMAIYTSIMYLVDDNHMTTGEFLAFSAAYGNFMGAMLAMSESLLNSVQILPIFERIKPIFEEQRENHEQKRAPARLRGGIEISHVSFSYESDAPLVLKDVNIRIRAGEYVAFVGESGSGKSTLMRLLLGFEKPNAGSILYDGQDLNSLDTRLLRRQIGVVLQDGHVIPGDIFSNIVGSSANLELEDAWEAARMAAFDEDIRSMPMGMHTIINEGGSTLSGGQKQRLMIARALVNRPKILLFDEATSALDNRTQSIVTDNLNQQLITRIVVAHRLSTIIDADRICFLKDGEITEQGNYKELMALKGEFHRLASRQIE